MKKRILFLLGGPKFHPVDQQSKLVAQWLGDQYDYEFRDGLETFAHLKDCDLFVPMGLHWPGMSVDWAGHMVYHPMNDDHKAAYERFVESGRPILVHHGAILNYSDWPRFGGLLGFSWIWGFTGHSPEIHEFSVKVPPSSHPLMKAVSDYRITDELYHSVMIPLDMSPTVHAYADYQGLRRPMVVSAEGGRVKGAGKVVWLANGHDMRAFEPPMIRQLWINSVKWLLGE